MKESDVENILAALAQISRGTDIEKMRTQAHIVHDKFVDLTADMDFDDEEDEEEETVDDESRGFFDDFPECADAAEERRQERLYEREQYEIERRIYGDK